VAWRHLGEVCRPAGLGALVVLSDKPAEVGLADVCLPAEECTYAPSLDRTRRPGRRVDEMVSAETLVLDRSYSSVTSF
jgi:hypothetical protein